MKRFIQYKDILKSIRGFSSQSTKKIFIGNLSLDTTAEDITSLIHKYPYVNIVLRKDLRDGNFRHFAFIDLPAQHCENFINEFNGVILNDRPLLCAKGIGDRITAQPVPIDEYLN